MTLNASLYFYKTKYFARTDNLFMILFTHLQRIKNKKKLVTFKLPVLQGQAENNSEVF